MLRAHLTAGTMPDELNPSYKPDRLNDRWPKDQKDMRNLVGALHRAQESDFSRIVMVMSDLFGERVSKRTIETLLERAADPAIQ
jgi:putative heme degradation protein